MALGLGCLMEQLRHVPIRLEVNNLADWGIQAIKEPCNCLLRELMHIRSLQGDLHFLVVFLNGHGTLLEA